jgi:hypothetical protein
VFRAPPEVQGGNVGSQGTLTAAACAAARWFAVRCPDIDPSEATALAPEVRELLSAPADGSPRISSTSPAVRCEDRDPGPRLRTTPSTPHRMNTCLMPSHSTTHPCRQNHSMPGCGLVIDRLTTVPSAEFFIAPSTTHRGPKFHVFVIAFDAPSPRNSLRSLRSRRNSGAPATWRVPGREYRAHHGLCRSRRSDHPRDATRGGVNRPALPGEPPAGGYGKAPSGSITWPGAVRRSRRERQVLAAGGQGGAALAQRRVDVARELAALGDRPHDQ